MTGFSTAPAVNTTDLVVRATGLGKRFGRVEALRGVSFEARGPSIFGLVGPDGAGKTTLLRVITGLLAYNEGKVTSLGIDPKRNPYRLKPRLGYVPQTFSMYPTLTVEENLRFAAQAHGLARAEYEPRMAELLGLARLAKFADRRAGDLSGGMQKKLSLVSALLPHPSLIVLDEPNAGVDIDARSEFWDVLRECARSALVLLATNYLDEANRCDRILYLASGRVLALGTPDEVRRGADVRVHLIRSPSVAPAALAAQLAHEPGLAVEVKESSVLVESPVAGEPMKMLLLRLGLIDAVAQPVEPTLETALLALERRARFAEPQAFLNSEEVRVTQRTGRDPGGAP